MGASDDRSAAASRGTGRRRRVWAWVAAGVALVLVILLSWAGRVHSANRAVEAEIKAAREAGYPMSIEALRAWHPEPVGEHAGKMYEQAFAMMVEDEELEWELPFAASAPSRGETWSDELLEVTQRYLALNADALEAIHEAVAMGRPWFEVDFGSQLGEHVPGVRKAARLLHLQSKWHAQRNEVDKAAEALLALWRVADALRGEPHFTSQLVRVANLTLAYDTTERLMADAALSPEQLAALQQAAEATDDGGQGMRRAVVGDRAITLDDFERVVRQVAQDARPLVPISQVTGRWQRELIAYLRMAAWVTAYMEEHPRRPISPESQRQMWGEVVSDRALVADRLFAAYTSAIMTDVTHNAMRDALVAGLAAARFEREHGPLPNSLDELVPVYLETVPIDPFDEAPLKYRRTQAGAIVYSVGRGGTDHEGRERDEYGSATRGREGTDITFTLGEAQRELWPEQWE